MPTKKPHQVAPRWVEPTLAPAPAAAQVSIVPTKSSRATGSSCRAHLCSQDGDLKPKTPNSTTLDSCIWTCLCTEHDPGEGWGGRRFEPPTPRHCAGTRLQLGSSRGVLASTSNFWAFPVQNNQTVYINRAVKHLLRSHLDLQHQYI